MPTLHTSPAAPASDAAGTLCPLRDLVRYAMMAPSSHNSQPWRFRIGEDSIDLCADPRRCLPGVDEDRRELRLSLGAALENLLVAAEHFGYRHEVTYFPDIGDAEWVARVVLAPDPRPWRPTLFAAIPLRRSNRRPFADRAVDPGLLRDLATFAWDLGIWGWTTVDPETRREVAALVSRGEHIEFADPAFRRAMGEWTTRGGLRPPWTLAGLARVALTSTDLGRRMARTDGGRTTESGALLAVISKSDTPTAQVRAGRAVQRVWLLATQFGLSVQCMTQPLRNPRLRRELAGLVGAGDAHPQHLFRIGYADPDPHHAPRRTLEEAILPGPSEAQD